MWDGAKTYTLSHLSQAITINGSTPAAQAFALSGPAAASYAVGSSVTIGWTASNVAAGSKISLCYDTDTTFNGNEKWIEIDAVAAANGSYTYNWDTSKVAAGTYYIGGYLWDGHGTFTTSHLTQAITLTGNSGNSTKGIALPSIAAASNAAVFASLPASSNNSVRADWLV
jgi:hypothetical protein